MGGRWRCPTCRTPFITASSDAVQPFRIRFDETSFSDFHASIAAHDDRAINPSRNAPLQDVIDRRRRSLLKGGLGLAGIAFSAAQWPAPGLLPDRRD